MAVERLWGLGPGGLAALPAEDQAIMIADYRMAAAEVQAAIPRPVAAPQARPTHKRPGG